MTTGGWSPGWMKRSRNTLLVVSSKSIIESQWWTCGVSRKRSRCFPSSMRTVTGSVPSQRTKGGRSPHQAAHAASADASISSRASGSSSGRICAVPTRQLRPIFTAGSLDVAHVAGAAAVLGDQPEGVFRVARCRPACSAARRCGEPTVSSRGRTRAERGRAQDPTASADSACTARRSVRAVLNVGSSRACLRAPPSSRGGRACPGLRESGSQRSPLRRVRMRPRPAGPSRCRCAGPGRR